MNIQWRRQSIDPKWSSIEWHSIGLKRKYQKISFIFSLVQRFFSRLHVSYSAPYCDKKERWIGLIGVEFDFTWRPEKYFLNVGVLGQCTVDSYCITGQLIRSHANSKMFLWHLRKVSNGLQLDACNNEDECYNRSLNISNGIKYGEITSKYFKLYDPSYTHLKTILYVHTYKTSCINIQSFLTI